MSMLDKCDILKNFKMLFLRGTDTFWIPFTKLKQLCKGEWVYVQEYEFI